MSTKKRKYRTLFPVLLLIAAVGLGVYFLLQPKNATSINIEDETIDIPFRKQGELVFIGKQTSDTLARIDIELADNDQLRARGLMYRRSLPENGGMLFIQEAEEMQSFWMKNTYISLDILFVNANKEIVTVHANTTPLKEWSYASTEPSMYVVEVNAGFAARHGIRTGDAIGFMILK